MSFRDELSNLTPTQKQIQVKATSEAQTNARLDYSGVKDLLRSKAQHNEYTTIGNHKYISCYYPDSCPDSPEIPKRSPSKVMKSTVSSPANTLARYIL